MRKAAKNQRPHGWFGQNMPRIARIVVPGVPHHIIQRGNRRQLVFFSDLDRDIYLHLLQKHSQEEGIKYWAYCLMTNHVHLIAVPDLKESFRKGIGETNRRYTCLINIRENWRGYLWQGRFQSYPMDESYLYRAIRYVENNPVRAGLVARAEQYHWSSARAHVFGERNSLLSDIAFLPGKENWIAYLAEDESKQDRYDFFRHARTGRPLGDDRFLSKLEEITGRRLRKARPGRRRNVLAGENC